MKVLSRILIILVFGIVSCKDGANTNKSHEHNHEKVTPKEAPNIAINDSISKLFSKAIFMNSIYENKVRADMLSMKANQNPSDVSILFNCARELLNNGDTQKSIEVINSILTVRPAVNNLSAETKMIHEFLAICYLRVGEQKNCQENHNDSSCIIPIAEKGQHEYEEGSRKAIEKYLQILKLFPEDYQSRWLLNVAYMTLGEYPDKVPSQFLIKINEKDSNRKMKNISSKLGIDGFGLSGGSIADDFNNDGFIDIFTTTWGTEGRAYFYKNKGDGSFENVTNEAGLSSIKGGLNAIQTDYNNDGFLDVYILRSGWMPEKEWGIMPNSLLRNNGDDTFTDVTIEVGLYSVSPSQSASWFDFDNDGDLDVFVANETNSNRESFPCQLFENDNFKFKDVSVKYQVNTAGYFKGTTTGDLNNDGWQDIYISNLKGSNLLFLAQHSNGKLTGYKESAIASGVQYPNASFPCWTFDFNNDGWEDLYVASYDKTAFFDQSGQLAKDLLEEAVSVESNYLYLNNGDGSFKDVTKRYFDAKSLSTMGCNYGDINNDGFLDFYLGTGAPDYRAVVPNRLFMNKDGKSFVDKTFEMGMGHIQKGHAISFADLDNDGDQDVYAVMGGAFKGDKFPNVLFNNQLENPNAWLKLKLQGTKSNRAAIGAKINILGTDKAGKLISLFKTVSSGASFGANTLIAEIGLGQTVAINEVRINWPNGKNDWESFQEIEVNTMYKIIEGNGVEKMTLNELAFNLENKSSHQHHH